MSGERGEPFFRTTARITRDAVDVPTVEWGWAGFYDWTKPVRKHKPQGRRRMTRDAVRATIGGVR